jgi:hypothetical protein
VKQLFFDNPRYRVLRTISRHSGALDADETDGAARSRCQARFHERALLERYETAESMLKDDPSRPVLKAATQ